MNKIEYVINSLPLEEYGALLVTSKVNRQYMTGFDSSAGALLMTAQGAWFITDTRYYEAAQSVVKGAKVLLSTKDEPYDKHIKEVLQNSKITTVGAEEATLTHAQYLEWGEKLEATLVKAQQFFIDKRAVKEPWELEQMKKAQKFSEKAFEEILPLISTGITEKELATELIYRILKSGADNIGFDPIVVSGTKSSLPHGVPGDKKISNGFLTIDFGAKVNGYISDTTRTVCVGKPTDEMINVYDTVLRAQLTALSFAKGGQSGTDIDAAARNVIKDAGFGDYFGHGLGHGIGLEVHEKPNATYVEEFTIPVGAVITIEPGIYLPGKFGVRIEDTIYMTAAGNENITSLPKKLLVL